MEATLNQRPLHLHCPTSVIGKSTLLSWTSHIRLVLERYFTQFLTVSDNDFFLSELVTLKCINTMPIDLELYIICQPSRCSKSVGLLT